MQDQSLIFLSHASEDKDFVDQVAGHLPPSHLFLDVKSIDPGQGLMDAMKEGVEDAALFCLFVSPSALTKGWVAYETTLATLKKIKGKALEILVVPIKGSTYADVPQWMQRYFAVPTSFTPFDVARTIRGAQEEALRAGGQIAQEAFVGREEHVQQHLLQLRSDQAKSGIFINVLIVAGFQGIGRRLFTRHLTALLYPGGRSYGPMLDLPPSSDAVDLYFGLRETRVAASSKSAFQSEFSSFNDLSPYDQAKAILEELKHYGQINQQVIVRTAFGLRDKDRELKAWTRELFDQLQAHPEVRVIFLSERSLPSESLALHRNVAQISLKEITKVASAGLLMSLVSDRDMSPLLVEEICGRIGGHPATLHYLAYLINERQRTAEAILSAPDEVLSFQDQLLKAVFEQVQGELHIIILHALSLFPHLTFSELSTIAAAGKAELARILAELSDYNLIISTADSAYSVPEIVRSTFRRKYGEAPKGLLKAASKLFQAAFESEEVPKSTVDKLLFAKVLETGRLPHELVDVVSPSTLHQLVKAEYDRGTSARGPEFRDSFSRAAELAKLADVIPMAKDTCEEILFWGADATARIGEDPKKLVDMMTRRGFASANYVIGYYAFYAQRDPTKAITHLKRALDLRSFTRRVTRLLSRVYLNTQRPRDALDVIDSLPASLVVRDSGLVANKYRALRALGRGKEAASLLPMLKSLGDQYGEFELLDAQARMRNGDRTGALKALKRAEDKPRANKLNIRFVRCTWQIDVGDFSTLDESCVIATAAGRVDEARHLRSRAALASGKPDEGYRLWHEIMAPNRIDFVLLARIIPVMLEGTLETKRKKLLQAELEKTLASIPGSVDR